MASSCRAWLKAVLSSVTFLSVTMRTALAADLREITVDFENDRYTVKSTTYFAAEPEPLYDVLTDYDRYERISSAFVEAYFTKPDKKGKKYAYTRMEGCVVYFCKSIERMDTLTLEHLKKIVATADPEQSDMKYSVASWILEPEGDGTVVYYKLEMEPSFWVPPVVGPYLLKRTLRKGGADAVDRIEALAQGREPVPD